MAISFVNAATITNTAGSGASSVVCNKPTNTADDDLLLAVVTSGNSVVTAPSGWAQLDHTLNTQHIWLFKKLAESEPANYTWQQGSSSNFTVAITAWRASSADFVEVNKFSIGTAGTGSSQTGADVTSTAAGYQVYFQGARKLASTTETTFTSASATAELYDTGSDNGNFTCSQAGYWIDSQVSAGTVTGKSVTFSQAVDVSNHYNVILEESNTFTFSYLNEYSSNGTWTCPPGVTAADAECWGGGGAGGGATGDPACGGGGGGGAYARTSSYSVTPGNNYTVTVGATATGTTGTVNGNDSWFDSTSGVLAKGGSGGVDSAVNNVAGLGGLGGLTATSVGTTKFAGGNGGQGEADSLSGGGGGGAGTTGAGGTNLTGTGAGVGTAVNGGDGGTGVVRNAAGRTGNVYGGGGSGGHASTATDRAGGNGAQGFVRVSASRIVTGGGGGPTPQDSCGILIG